jgi:hypothetical protein
MGYTRPLAVVHALFVPALRKGFSVLPAPDTTPIVAQQFPLRFMDFPDGSLIRVPSEVWDTMDA